MPEKIKLADRKHPLFTDNSAKWDLYRDSVKGGDNFINSDNLFTHRLEEETDFTERLTRAYYLNYCDVIPTIYNNYIFKETVNRPPDETLAYFRTNCDGRGTNISDFVKKIGFFSKIFGAMHALVDMPPKTKTKINNRQAKDMNLNPYCSLVYPSQLVDWSLDSSGNLNWVIISSIYYSDLDPAKARVTQTHYKLITREEWRVEDSDGNPVKYDDGSPNKGPNELGIVPLITMYHQDVDDDKIGESLIKDIVYINRTILNWCSCIDEMIERQTFSQLVVPDDGSLAEASETGDDPLRRVSTSSVWTFNAESRHPPAYISPNTENIITIWNLTLDHVKEIFRIGGLVGSTEDMYASTSGRSKQMGFMSVNSALVETSNRYQKFENDVSEIAYMLLGKNVEEYQQVKYPDSFDIAALEDEVESLFSIMGKNFSARLNKTMMKNIARKAVPLADEATRQEIDDEIESGDGMLQPDLGLEIGSDGKPIRPEPEDEDGNPNSDLGKSFRSKDKLNKRNRTHRPADKEKV
jgi:hypothetical protein